MILLLIVVMILFLLSKLYVPIITLSERETTKNYQNFLAKDLKDYFNGTNIKQKVRIKIRQMNFDIFSNQILLIHYLF